MRRLPPLLGPRGDGVGDACDNCPSYHNPDQSQADPTDADQDGQLCIDNCVGVTNADQLDGDGDGIGDACDNCPVDFNPDQAQVDATDADGDGWLCTDNCIGVFNPDQLDTEQDGIGDACDLCPIEPGDGSDEGGGEAAALAAALPISSALTDPGDGDGDGYVCADNCPGVYNADQLDGDQDGLGDVCDSCPLAYDPTGIHSDPNDTDGDTATCLDNCVGLTNDQLDSDGDGWGDACDNCVLSYNPDQTDGDHDGQGDACDPCGAIIDNGLVQLGVNCAADLNFTYPNDPLGLGAMGLRYMPTGAAATEPGCLCEGWGVADATSGVAGFANEDEGGATNIDVLSFTSTPNSAVSVVQVGTTFIVTHDYHPSPDTPNLYEVIVTVENISAAEVQLLYRRVMDWDIYPTAFSEYVTIDNGTAAALFRTDTNGFNSANPFVFESYAPGPVTDIGPDDIGALFDFDFGALAPGATRQFRTFYGAAGSEVDALAALRQVSAEAFSLGQPSTPLGPTLGDPNTFIFGFAGIGGTPVDCGNGVLEAGEVCDDANLTDGDGCDSNCTITSCGNHVVTAGEVCDDGNAIDGDGCDSNCTATACGNGVITEGEACDDGNAEPGDCCSETCELESAFTVCRASAGACDAAETCTGVAATCPEDAKSVAVCRASAGDCDVAETCDGASNDCPTDVFVASDTTCRESAGDCDVAETCTGTGASCPA
ncbi:hypothetical protein L6R52_34365, partial [Myxococcota bacterium]|nr:hypothetical protein [Myxococcota bacterium]